MEYIYGLIIYFGLIFGSWIWLGNQNRFKHKIVAFKKFMSKGKRRMDNLVKKEHRIESAYNSIVEDIQCLMDDFVYRPDGNPYDFDFTNIRMLKNWSNGTISVETLAKNLGKSNMEKMAVHKLVGPLVQYQSRMTETYNHLNAVLSAAIQQIEKTIAKDYEEYLLDCEKFFRDMNEHMKNEVKIVYFYENPMLDEKSKQEMSYDQTIRYIKSKNIQKEFAHGMVFNDYILKFAKSHGHRSPCHMFIGPEEYIQALKRHFNVSNSKSTINKTETIKDIMRRVEAA